MIIPKTYISPKNAFIGIIIGVSVGLGLINLDLCPELGLLGAIIFGVKREVNDKKYPHPFIPPEQVAGRRGNSIPNS